MHTVSRHTREHGTTDRSRTRPHQHYESYERFLLRYEHISRIVACMKWRASVLLEHWMQRNGVSQLQFSRLVEAELHRDNPDAKFTQGTVSRWLKRGVVPRPRMRVLVARITRGEVPAVAWFEETDDGPGANGKAA